MRSSSNKQSGFTLIEVAIGMVILLLVYLSLLNSFKFISSQSVRTSEKTFAVQKSMQMMEELRGILENSGGSIKVLDDYDDGISTRAILSIRSEVLRPEDPISGNTKLKFGRRISVTTLPNDMGARKVYIRFYRLSDMEVLAETISVLRTTVPNDAPTQTFDMYFIGIENVTGAWATPADVKPILDNAISDLHTRNPNLEIKPHFITRLGYGRDPFYSPNSTPADWATYTVPNPADLRVYYYPWYAWPQHNWSGRWSMKGVPVPANPIIYTSTGTYGGTMADMYNCTVRYPDEAYLYACATAAAAAAGQEPPEISLRMLYEKLNSSRAEMRNAIIMPLHGELLPVPPMRNYSDPATEPVNYSSVCVVAHPEQIQYTAGQQVKLRVYAYVINPNAAGWNKDSEVSTMSIVIHSTGILPSHITIRRLTGDTDTKYLWGNAISGSDYVVSNPTTTFRGVTSSATLITLYNTRLRNGQHAPSNTGLKDTARLWDYEYIPCCLSGATFSEMNRDLADTTPALNPRPKNTARWVISIADLSNREYCFETRIGSNTKTGSANNQPTNMSRSYFWLGIPPPFTEQFQYIGDPRHMPYSDAKGAFYYNWFFKLFAGADWPSFSHIRDAYTNTWGSSPMNSDILRYFQTIRTGIMGSGAFWVFPFGWSSQYVGFGGEFITYGMYENAIVWDPTDNSGTSVTELTFFHGVPNKRGSRLISRDGGGADRWWGRYWIGELYPPGMYNVWASSGNLPVGVGNFYRDNRYSSLGLVQPSATADYCGAQSFFNGNTGKDNMHTFTHKVSVSADNAPVTSTGTAVALVFNNSYPLMLGTQRRFSENEFFWPLGYTVAPPGFNDAPYQALRTYLAKEDVFYEYGPNPTDWDASAVILVSTSALSVDPGPSTPPWAVARVIVNALEPRTETIDTGGMVKMGIINSIRAFMRAGASNTTHTFRVKQVPLVSISTPLPTTEFNNPMSIPVVWTSTWTRWDGAKYTDDYPENFSNTAGTAPLVFCVKYSNDNGATWNFCQYSSDLWGNPVRNPARAGVRGRGYGPWGAGGTYSFDETLADNVRQYTWDTSDATLIPRGTYLIRVEGYRRDIPMHSTHHQVRIYIKR